MKNTWQFTEAALGFCKKASEMAVKKNVNQACIFWFYQKKIPIACNKFKNQ